MPGALRPSGMFLIGLPFFCIVVFFAVGLALSFLDAHFSRRVTWSIVLLVGFGLMGWVSLSLGPKYRANKIFDGLLGDSATVVELSQLDTFGGGVQSHGVLLIDDALWQIVRDSMRLKPSSDDSLSSLRSIFDDLPESGTAFTSKRMTCFRKGSILFFKHSSRAE